MRNTAIRFARVTIVKESYESDDCYGRFAPPSSVLERNFDQLGFEECTLGEYIQEEIAFLEGLDLENCIFFGMHASNPVPVLGHLPEDKDRLLRQLR